MIPVVYFSSASENTRRFVDKLGVPAARIPLYRSEEALLVADPYVLVLPTYGGGTMGGAVPKQVIRFLNVAENRALIRGVVTGGNTNFGRAYCLAGEIVARKCGVPHLYRFELMGTPDDVEAVREGLTTQWLPLCSLTPGSLTPAPN